MKVNVETDVAAKYQEAIERHDRAADNGRGVLTLTKLRELGFTE
jgi:hypothetical protein